MAPMCRVVEYVDATLTWKSSYTSLEKQYILTAHLVLNFVVLIYGYPPPPPHPLMHHKGANLIEDRK